MSKKIKARITYDGNCWNGEVYGYNGHNRWEVVTTRCITKIGARIELWSWKRKNLCEEFEL